VFQRLTLKTNTGLVIDQIDNYHVLSQLISATTPVSRAVSVQEGRDQESVFVDGSMKADACVAQKLSTIGVPIRHFINNHGASQQAHQEVAAAGTYERRRARF
jgi:hypothetical protein